MSKYIAKILFVIVSNERSYLGVVILIFNSNIQHTKLKSAREIGVWRAVVVQTSLGFHGRAKIHYLLSVVNGFITFGL